MKRIALGILLFCAPLVAQQPVDTPQKTEEKLPNPPTFVQPTQNDALTLLAQYELQLQAMSRNLEAWKKYAGDLRARLAALETATQTKPDFGPSKPPEKK